MTDLEDGSEHPQRRIGLVGTHHFLTADELVGAVQVKTMGRDVVLRLTNGECVVVKSTDLDSSFSAESGESVR